VTTVLSVARVQKRAAEKNKTMTPPAPSAAIPPFPLIADINIFELGIQEQDLWLTCHRIMLY
jgi:hypothetical protein